MSSTENPKFRLISFKLCPFVQRSVITLEEKSLPYDIEYIDLSNKPDWFLDLSPLGKVPVLQVNGTVLFESAVINEYIEEVSGGGMLPKDPLAKARARAWIEFASALLFTSYSIELATTKEETHRAADRAREALARLEREIDGEFFLGEEFSLVDAATAPGLQRLTWYEKVVPSLEPFRGLEKVAAWRDTLLKRPTIQRSTVVDIWDEFLSFQAKKVERATSEKPAPWFSQQAVAQH